MNREVYSFLSGILIGTCMILPGISGSVVAIMLGMYDEVFILINNNCKNIIKIKKLFPLCMGIIVGALIFGKILLVFYKNYSFYMMYIFIGLILGSIPLLLAELNKKNEHIKIKYLIISFIVSLLMFLLSKILNFNNENSLNFFNMLLGGFLYISGKIIPGISSSFFLIILGIYEYMLNIITNPFSITIDVIVSVFPFAIGMIIGMWILVKLINFLLKQHFSETYSLIIGFILGSIVAIFPGFEFSIKELISIIYMLISFLLVNKLSKK